MKYLNLKFIIFIAIIAAAVVVMAFLSSKKPVQTVPGNSNTSNTNQVEQPSPLPSVTPPPLPQSLLDAIPRPTKAP